MPAARAQVDLVAHEQKISETAGGFSGPLDEDDVFGRATASLGDLDGDGVPDLAVGAPGDDDGGPDRGAVYVLLLNPDGTVKDEQKISSTAGGLMSPLDDGDRFGLSVAGLSDFDMDGTVDLAVGAPGDDDGGPDRGAVYLLLMNPDGTVKAEQKISDVTGTMLNDEDEFGSAVAGIGDVDDDGMPDLAVGAIRSDGPTSAVSDMDKGAVYILFLNTAGTVKAAQKIDETEGGLTAPIGSFDFFGFALAALGDLDGDGVEDVAVGSRGDVTRNDVRGRLYILFLNADGTVRMDQTLTNLEGGLDNFLNAFDLFSYSVASLGDVNGDGVPDLAVGATGDDDGDFSRGAVYLLMLNPDGTALALQKISDTQGGLDAVLDDFDLFGSALAPLGDLDGDGMPELAVGAQEDDDGGPDHGAVYVLSLRTDTSPPECGRLIPEQDPQTGKLAAIETSASDPQSGITSVTFTRLKNANGFVDGNGPFAQGDVYTTPAPSPASITIRGERIRMNRGGSVVVKVRNGVGRTAMCDPVLTTVDADTPTRFDLGPNYPNPFNPSTVIPFSVAEAAHVRLTVYDALGREVARLVDEAMEPGTYRADWDSRTAQGTLLPSGLYLYRLQAGGHTETRSMLLLK